LENFNSIYQHEIARNQTILPPLLSTTNLNSAFPGQLLRDRIRSAYLIHVRAQSSPLIFLPLPTSIQRIRSRITGPSGFRLYGTHISQTDLFGNCLYRTGRKSIRPLATLGKSLLLCRLSHSLFPSLALPARVSVLKTISCAASRCASCG
jgi:hypothetical protein